MMKINYLKHKSVFILALFIFSNSALGKSTELDRFELGETATEEQINAWDIDVRPDGHGYPEGSGTASAGEDLYDEKCASCHGSFGEGEGSWPKLIGEVESIRTGVSPEKAVGTFWAHPSTLVDYIHRAMPFTQPQSLSWEETWSITAYVLFLNDIITDEEFVLDKQSILDIKMPNHDHFIKDQRPDTHAKRCMKNCKSVNQIKIKTFFCI